MHPMVNFLRMRQVNSNTYSMCFFRETIWIAHSLMSIGEKQSKTNKIALKLLKVTILSMSKTPQRNWNQHSKQSKLQESLRIQTIDIHSCSNMPEADSDLRAYSFSTSVSHQETTFGRKAKSSF